MSGGNENNNFQFIKGQGKIYINEIGNEKSNDTITLFKVWQIKLLRSGDFDLKITFPLSPND